MAYAPLRPPSLPASNQSTAPMRVCVFAHFDSRCRIDPHVFYTLRALAKVTDRLIFVSACALPRSERQRAGRIADRVVIRRNRGLDFGSWKAGLTAVDLRSADELVLCNDSCFGPLGSFEQFFGAMEKEHCDFWGITASREIRFHVQSYFLVFRKSVLRDPAFADFWDRLVPQSLKSAVILINEVGLTRLLVERGHVPGTYFRLTLGSSLAAVRLRAGAFWTDFMGVHPASLRFRLVGLLRMARCLSERLWPVNPSHVYWPLLMKCKVPLIKVELLRDNPLDVDLKGLNHALKDQVPRLWPMIQRYLARNAKRETRILSTMTKRMESNH